MTRRGTTIVLLGLMGLVVAACLGYLALQLVSQPVGLSQVPVSAGDELVGREAPGVTSGTAAPRGAPSAPVRPPPAATDGDRSDHSKDGLEDDHHDEHDDDDD